MGTRMCVKGGPGGKEGWIGRAYRFPMSGCKGDSKVAEVGEPRVWKRPQEKGRDSEIKETGGMIQL